MHPSAHHITALSRPISRLALAAASAEHDSGRDARVPNPASSLIGIHHSLPRPDSPILPHCPRHFTDRTTYSPAPFTDYSPSYPFFLRYVQYTRNPHNSHELRTSNHTAGR